ncbi:Ty1/Copia family ribonuclease HI, partial [Modestobacter lapidis]|nr:Ty1/Copia family ribonuclease HI [Modestobacter lapidis]
NTVRVDICYAVNLLSQFVVSARKTHLNAAYKVFHYLIHTKDLGIVYGKQSTLEFKDFRLLDKTKNKSDVATHDYPADSEFMVTTLSDSDWAKNQSDRKSQSGHCVFINNQLVSWSSRKQNCVSLSSTEAEYVALSSAARSSLYFRNLLNEIGYDCSYINLAGDNFGSLTLGSHKSVHQKTKP